MRTLILICFLGLNGFAGLANNLDSLRQIVNHDPEVSNRLEATLGLINYYGIRNGDSTTALGQRGLLLAEEANNNQAKVHIFLSLGLIQHNKGFYKKAKSYYYQAMELAQSLDDAYLMAEVHSSLGVTNLRSFEQDSAFHHLKESEKLHLANGDSSRLWLIYKSLYELYDQKNELKEAADYVEKAYEAAEAYGSRMNKGFVLFHALSFYLKHGFFEQLGKYQEKWSAYQVENKSSKEIMESPAHIALFMMGNEKEDMVETQLQEAVVYFKEKNNLVRTGLCLRDLGLLYKAQGKWNAFEATFLEAATYFKQSGTSYYYGKALFQLYQYYKEQRKPGLALDKYEQYEALADSLAGVAIEANLNELEVKYETEQKEQALQIQALEIQQRTQQRNWLLLSSLLLGLLAILIVMFYRNRLKINRKLAAQESVLQNQRIQQLEQEKQLVSLNAMLEGQERERIRIANDLHDSLGGILTAAKAHFTSLNKPAIENSPGLSAQTAQLLDHAGVELRRISHNLAPRSLSLLGLEGALEDLALQLRQQGLQCSLQLYGLANGIPQTISIMLWRIIQEATNNILKHAEATSVLIQIMVDEDDLNLTIEDNGKGFDWEAAQKSNSLGVNSIQSRVRFLKGQLEVDTAPGQGTSIMIQVPRGIS